MSYEAFGLNMSKQQLSKVLTSAKKGTSCTIRLSKNNLHGDQRLPLTKTQINQINKTKKGLDLTFSATQLKYFKKIGETEKTGGLFPLLALIPLLLKGAAAVGALAGGVGGLAGGVSSAVASKNASRAAEEKLAEQFRHNKVIESQLERTGSGMLSNLAGKIPVFGHLLKYGLEKLGLGFYLDPKGRGFYSDPQGSGFYLEPRGIGYFLALRPE